MVRIRSRSVPIRILTLVSLWILSSAVSPLILSLAHAEEDPQATGEITYQPNTIPEVEFYYEDHNFVLEYKSFYMKIRPFVIYQGQYYGLKQIVEWIQAHYPSISYKWLVEKGLDLIHYGFNLTEIPQEVADKIDYLGFRLVDLNFPLSWIKLVKLSAKNPSPIALYISEANLWFSFQDLQLFGYSVEYINSTYVLIGNVKGKTDWNLDPITRSGDTMSITGGTEESPIENVYWEFWNASYVNGWNLAFRNQFGAQFAFNGTLQIGDWETETWVTDEEKQVLFFGENDSMYFADYSHFRNGELIDESTKTTSRGCSLYFNYTGPYSMGIWGDYESDVIFYDTTFRILNGYFWTWFDGNLTYYGCKFINVGELCTSVDGTSNWYDVKVVENDGLYFEEPMPSMEDITVLNTTYIAWFYLYGNITIKELYGRNAQEYSFVIGYSKPDSNVYLLNPDVDSWTFRYSSAITTEIYRQYTFDAFICYRNGTGINGTSTGARVVISHYGQAYAVDYNETLGEDGALTTQTLSKEFFNQTGGDIPYSYEPFNIQISNVSGYQDYNANFTLSGKTSWEISLLEETSTETYSCTWIGTNNTEAGEPTKFISSWEELYDGVGLSHWLCSTNNTGTWLNSSWSSSWADTYWAEYELTLNSTEDLTVAFCFYVNDTDGDEWSSANCTFTTPVTRVYEGPFFGVTHRVDYGLTLLVVSPPERNPSFQEFLYDKVEIPVELIILNREDRAREFDLSYTVLSESGELLKEGDLSVDVEPKAQQPVSFSFQVPYGKREAPKNFSVSLLANGGENPITLELTLSHSALSFIFPLAFIGAIALIIGVAYYFLRRKPHGSEIK